MLKKLTLIFAVFVGAGCALAASTDPSAWTPAKPEISQDLMECRAYGRAHSPQNPLIAGELTQDCMELKGYRRR